MRLKQLIEEQQVANEKRCKDEVNKRLASAHRNVSHGVEAAQWHRDAEVIKARMKKLEKEVWSRKKQATALAKYGSLDTVSMAYVVGVKLLIASSDDYAYYSGLPALYFL